MRIAFLILAITIPCFAGIELVGRFTDGPATGLCKDGDIIYVASGGSIVSVDVSDPYNPIYLGHFQTGDIADQPSVDDGVLITGANVYHYYLLDVSNPREMNCIWWFEPLESPPYDGTESEFLGHCRIRDSLVYLAGHDGYNFFRIEDMRNPAHPETLAQISGLDYNPMALAINSDYAFEVGGNCVWVFDITPPDSAQRLFTYLIGAEFGTFFMPGVEVFNDTLVCVSHSTGVWAFTTRFLPDSLHLLWRFVEYLPFDYGWDCWIDEPYVFLANQSVIRMGVIEGDSVRNVVAIPSDGACYDVVADDGFLYAAGMNGGLSIFSYADPDTLEKISQLDPGDATVDLLPIGDSMLVSRGTDGFVFYVPDDDSVRISKRYDFGDARFGNIDTAMVGGMLVGAVASGGNGFYIFRVSSDSIRILTHHTDFLTNGANAVLAQGCSLWVGQSYYFGITPTGGKLQLFDISTPASPSLIREWTTPNVEQIARFENRLYVLCPGELRIYDISDTLEYLGSYGGMYGSLQPNRCTSFDIARFGTNIYAYVTHMGWVAVGAFNGLFTFDVTDPSDTILLVDIDSLGSGGLWYNRAAVNVKVVGTNLCLYDNCIGWIIYSLVNPAEPETIAGAFWQHNGNGNGYGLLFDPPNIYSCTGDDGFYHLRFDSTTRIREFGGVVPDDNLKLSVYPNPFNASIEATVFLPEKGFFSFDILDILGRKIHCEKSYSINREARISWHPEQGIPSGVYFIKITANGSATTKKVVYTR
jgi:hypothetical protein